MAITSSVMSRALIVQALKDGIVKFHPRELRRSPVMAIVAIGAVATSIALIVDMTKGSFSGVDLQITLWLWGTVYFANIAESIAEGRGKAQADALRRSRQTTTARKMVHGVEQVVGSSDLHVGDLVVCETGDLIPLDGDVIDGIASVDESAITGESAPVIRESGGDRSAVTGGTRVLSDRIVIRITVEPGQAFLDRIIGMVEGAQRQRTPNEIALSTLLIGLTVVFVLVVITLPFFTQYLSSTGNGSADTSISVLMALLVCLIPTTIGGLLSAIGISGMDRLLRSNVVAMSGRAVEAAGDIDVLLLDKTGTITFGNRSASEFLPAPGVSVSDLARAAYTASLADETPEGRSIVHLARHTHNIRDAHEDLRDVVTHAFTAQTRMSGADFVDVSGTSHHVRKGAADAVEAAVVALGGSMPKDVRTAADKVASAGSTPLVVSDGNRVLGVVELKDIVKGGIRERFERLRLMGIRTVMITGDNPLTAAAIAAEAGVDDFIAEAKPEDKLARIRLEQSQGRLVAMIGDGTNDAPALAQADVGVAMNSGTQAAREAGNMIDLDSNPTKLIEIVETGKQLLMTRGALTTFSIANDVSKYFAILPAMFAGLYVGSDGTSPMETFNIMGLASPQSAILSAVIFNALIIVALIPLALRGVTYKPQGVTAVLRRNVLIYGLGGLVIPFVGIKLLDIVITALGLA
ncbi:MAG TPA: potassium-transporting ATPase subunit KdpB [Candidatus Didemnitutus sp.]|nr:potassium-transporting ATPase subunit KdpB [Candidatus Didemnitutus sp.]